MTVEIVRKGMMAVAGMRVTSDGHSKKRVGQGGSKADYTFERLPL